MNYRTDRWKGFKNYYRQEMLSWDQSPAFPTLSEYSNHNTLKDSERYWLSFLYGCTYCVPTAIHLFEQLPSIKNISKEGIEKFWKENKHRLLFQSDRTKVKYTNQFPKMILSYQSLVSEGQTRTFDQFFKTKDLKERYNQVYTYFDQLFYFSRFSLFNYLEVLDGITDLKLEPSWLDLKLAESARNGLCYTCSLDNMVTLHHHHPQTKVDYPLLNLKLEQLYNELKTENPDLPVSIFNIETVLCAYKKLFWETRYLGYYIDRYQEEITTMKKLNPKFNAKFHYDTRSKYIHPFFLGEKSGWNGIRDYRKHLLVKFGSIVHPSETLPEMEFKCI